MCVKLFAKNIVLFSYFVILYVTGSAKTGYLGGKKRKFSF